MCILANRIRKRFKHFGKWARRQNIGCFRVYDHDIPEYPVIVDWYEGRAAAWLSERTRDVTTEEKEAFRADASAQILDGLGLEDPSLLFLKDRRPGGQYRRTGHGKEGEFTVSEGGMKFLVNLGTHHDTGLFLDHRQTRSMAAAEVSGRSFLNLFCYTGSFTVYAAAAGARRTVSVDLSGRYLDWLERNLVLNNLNHGDNALIEDDASAWLRDAAASMEERFDVIVCDPPTFSNSKQTGAVWDVSRGHAEMIRSCLKILNPGGVLYFSTNKRNFVMDEISVPQVECREITSQTVPPDFAASKSHRCWTFRKKLLRVGGAEQNAVSH